MNQKITLVKSLLMALFISCLMPNVMNAQWSQIFSSVYLTNSSNSVKIGGTLPTIFGQKFKLAVFPNDGQNGIYGNAAGENRIAVYGYNATGWAGYFNGKAYVRGNMGIGTTNTTSGYRLAVKGGIVTDEVKVELCSAGGWCDYVFEEDYDLKTLAEVEAHIKAKGHLHKTPSAKEVEENGLLLKEMTINQQEKIEELFLHMIDMNKKLTNEKDQLLEKLAQMEARLTALERQD